MTLDQQRIAIAEACGWEYANFNYLLHGIWQNVGSFPNYPQDLNAIHEARKALVTTTELRVKYLNALRAIVARRCPKNKTGASLVTDYDLINAEAWEHAETLVKVSGKWVEA